MANNLDKSFHDLSFLERAENAEDEPSFQTPQPRSKRSRELDSPGNKFVSDDSSQHDSSIDLDDSGDDKTVKAADLTQESDSDEEARASKRSSCIEGFVMEASLTTL